MKNRFKKIFLLIPLSVLGIMVSSCDSGFDDLNINKAAATAINPVFILNNAVVNASYPTGTIVYEVGIVQQVISPNSGVLTGANFNQDNRNATQENWQRYYRNVIRNTSDVLNQTKDTPARSNLYNMARILQSYAFLILTDTYGSIPYTDAGRGYPEQLGKPKYDTQQSIYTGIIKELTEASAALDPAKIRETADVLYGGDVALWKRFANSLLLRVGMRMSKVDAAQAQQVVSRAFAAGVMAANADNAFVRHDANYLNPVAALLNGSEANNFYLTAPFVSHLKSTNDPRLRSIAVRYVGAASGPQQTAARANTTADVQVGMPMGFDNASIVPEATKAGLASFYDYSQVDRTRLMKPSAPAFLVTASQTQLLLAEAANRGWVTGTSAEAYYRAGVRLHMEQMAIFDAGAAVSNTAIDAYLTANPFENTKALEQINTQYWIASFLNGPEAFANFRRSGFPNLTPNPFAGKGIKGSFIRRLTYPNSEFSVNGDNVKAATTAQGADDLDTRVWWDK